MSGPVRGGAVALLAATAAWAPTSPAQVVVEVRLPAGVSQEVAAALRAVVGSAIDVREPAAAAAPAPGALVVALEVELQRLAASASFAALGDRAAVAGTDPESRWVLAFGLTVEVVAAPPLAEREVAAFEALALHPALQDRLLLLPPGLDPVPWLLGMHECLLRGGGAPAGFGLWTALDARIAAYPDDLEAVVAALRQSRASAAVLPTPVVRARRLADGAALRAYPIGAPLAIGLAIAGPAAPAALAMVERLAGSDRRRLADRAQLVDGADAAVRFPAADVAQWLHQFESRIRGQGRRVERVANILDYVFTALFLGIVVAVWWRQRRGKAA